MGLLIVSQPFPALPEDAPNVRDIQHCLLLTKTADQPDWQEHVFARDATEGTFQSEEQVPVEISFGYIDNNGNRSEQFTTPYTFVPNDTVPPVNPGPLVNAAVIGEV